MSSAAVEIFSSQLNMIAQPLIRDFVELSLRGLPTYFEHIPASSSGKYHPFYALGVGGLVRHTKAAVLVAQDIFNSAVVDLSQEEKDIIVGALILHDGLKHGSEEGHTLFEHPKLMAEYCKRLLAYNFDMFYKVNKSLNQLISCISSHMGKWNTSDSSDIILPIPTTRLEKIVHFCDYMASRKHYEVNTTVWDQKRQIIEGGRSQ